MKSFPTFALAACFVSLPLLPARAEENPNQLITSLGSTTIHGYVDTPAHWTASKEPLPADYHSWPAVFVTARRVVREYSNPIIGYPGYFQFKVHRVGPSTNAITVYLNFQLRGGVPAQGGVTIPAGERIGYSTWLLPDNWVEDGPRTFTASISLSAVRQQLPGAHYKLHHSLPYQANVLILDPFSPTR